MDEDDLPERIRRLQAEMRARKEALEEGSLACEAKLRVLLAKLVNIHESVLQTKLLAPPQLQKGYWRGTDPPSESNELWHNSQPDGYGSAPLVIAGGARITCHPYEDHWRLSGEGTTEPHILEWYSDYLTKWAVHRYPAMQARAEAQERREGAERERQERSAGELSPWEARQRRELIQIIVNFVLVILGFFLVLSVLKNLFEG
jgi:hypothetical protein